MSSNDQPLLQVWGSDICELLAGAVDDDLADSQNQHADVSQQNDADDCISVVSYNSEATEEMSADMNNSDRIMAWLEDVQEGVYEEDWSMYSREEEDYAAADFFFSEFELDSDDFEAMLKKDGELIGADENAFDLDYLKFSRRDMW